MGPAGGEVREEGLELDNAPEQEEARPNRLQQHQPPATESQEQQALQRGLEQG